MTNVVCKEGNIVAPIGLWTVYLVSIVLCTLYLYTLQRVIRRAYSELLIFLIVSMIVVNVLGATWQFSNFKYWVNACQPATLFNQATFKRTVIGMGLSGMINSTLDTLVHWMFAFKYWTLSYLI